MLFDEKVVQRCTYLIAACQEARLQFVRRPDCSLSGGLIAIDEKVVNRGTYLIAVCQEA